MWEILSAIFGFGRYEFEVHFTNKQHVRIKAKNFIDAVERAEDEYQLNVAYVKPLEDVLYSDASRGSNMYIYKTSACADVFAEDEIQAKKNFPNYAKTSDVTAIEVKEPIWVNKDYYKGF